MNWQNVTALVGFGSAGAFALWAIGNAVRIYGPDITKLRRQMCAPDCNITVRIQHDN